MRRDTDDDWKAYIRRLMQEEGVIGEDDEPTDEDLRRYDRQRKGKKISNDQWRSSSDDDARIVKMKTGHTRMGCKAEHTVGLKSEVVLSASVRHGTDSDSRTLVESTVQAQVNLATAGSDADVREVVADKGGITAMPSWQSATCWACEPIFRNHRLRTDGGGRTNRRP